jgi:hypothetical protein
MAIVAHAVNAVITYNLIAIGRIFTFLTTADEKHLFYVTFVYVPFSKLCFGILSYFFISLALFPSFSSSGHLVTFRDCPPSLSFISVLHHSWERGEHLWEIYFPAGLSPAELFFPVFEECCEAFSFRRAVFECKVV